MKKVFALVLSVLLTAAMFGCKNSQPSLAGNHPEGFALYYAQLGQKWDTALENLGLDATDFTADSDEFEWDLVATTQYGGYTWSVTLIKDRTTDRLSHVRYWMLLEDTRDTLIDKTKNLVGTIAAGFEDKAISLKKYNGMEGDFLHKWDDADWSACFDESIAEGEGVLKGEYWVTDISDNKNVQEFLKEYKVSATEKDKTLLDNVDLQCRLQVTLNGSKEGKEYSGFILEYSIKTYREGVTYWEE